MKAPIKFDFSSYPAAIPAIPAIREQEEPIISAEAPCYSCYSAIPEQESDHRIAGIAGIASSNAKNAKFPDDSAPPPNSRIAGIARANDDFQDDRHHCRECRNMNNVGYCTAQRFRPVDDIPRRCKDFNGWPATPKTNVSNAQDEGLNIFRGIGDTDPLIVEVFTPSGTAMVIRADNAEHAEWLRRMNPRPANPTPKPDPTPSGRMVIEADHNAAGRHFKFMATWEDCSQCYLCQMPRQTIDEMRAQYPTAANIQPIENETYPHD